MNNKMNLTLWFDLGITDGDSVRKLASIIGEDKFSQRKSYDEYYCNVQSCDVEVSMNELMGLSHFFDIELGVSSILITCSR